MYFLDVDIKTVFAVFHMIEPYLIVVSLLAADLRSMRLTAEQYLKLGEDLGLTESVMNARYFLGSVHYQQNELAKAETSLVPVVSNRRAPNLQYFSESVFALASVHQARGQTEKARETVEAVCEHLLSIRTMGLLQCAQAYQADLALRQGRMAEAMSWAQGFDDEPAARETLGRAVVLAQPGGFIRLFVDLGAGIPRLLNRLDLDVQRGCATSDVSSMHSGAMGRSKRARRWITP